MVWNSKVRLLLILLPTFSFGQVIKTDIFTVEYDQNLEQPLWVEYTVLCPNGDEDRTGLNFYTVQGIHTSDDDDYSNNIWDKGHIAPAAAFNCDRETLKKTFSYLNSALQHQGLNRGVWRVLEEFERNLANLYEVKVRVDILFEGNLTVLPTGATVPSGFKKTIYWDDRQLVLIFPNIDTKGTHWNDYIIK